MQFFRTKITFIVQSLSKRSREQLQGYLTFYAFFQGSFHDNLNATNTGKHLIPRLKGCQNSPFVSFSKQTYIFLYSSWLRKCCSSKEAKVPFFSSPSYLCFPQNFVNYTLQLTDTSSCEIRAKKDQQKCIVICKNAGKRK